MNDDLLSFKERLNAISPTSCLVKWKHATVSLGSQGVKTCCHHPMRKMELKDDHEALHDTAADRSIREALLKGEKPEACNHCWAVEDLGHYSDRIYWSQIPWLSDFYEQVEKHKSSRALSPSWLEMNFSNLCNLKCSYCNPGFSTSWQKEVGELGPYPTSPPHNDLGWFVEQGLLHKDNEAKSEKALENKAKIWTWFEKALPHVRHLTLTGGEPLLSRECFDFFAYLERNPHPNLTVAVNSNLCLPASIWERFMETAQSLVDRHALKGLYLHPSLDSWGRRAEYIRFGLDLTLFEKNLRSFLEKTNLHVVLNCTLNNLSLGGLLDYWKFVIELKREHGMGRDLSSTSEVLVAPAWQRLDLLPLEFESYLIEVEDLLISAKPLVSDHEIDGIRRARAFLRAGAERDEALRSAERANFYRFFASHDERRKTDFMATFPELHDFYHACRELVEPKASEPKPKEKPLARFGDGKLFS